MWWAHGSCSLSACSEQMVSAVLELARFVLTVVPSTARIDGL
jgi:hypothetical protein